MAQAGLFGGGAKTTLPMMAAPVHGTGWAIADALLGGWLGYGERQRLARDQRAGAMQSWQEMNALLEPPPPTAADPSQPLNAGSNPAVQPQATIPSLTDPKAVQAVLRAKMFGLPAADAMLELMKATKPADPQWAVGPDGTPYNQHAKEAPATRFANPTVINGWVQNINYPNLQGRYFGAAPAPGMNPVIGENGQLDWSMPRQALSSLGQVKQAESRGSAAGSAPYEFINVPTPTGAPRTVAKSVAAGGSFMGQSPVEAKEEGAAAEARIALPDAEGKADRMLKIIDDIRTDPAMRQRTGVFSKVPAIPGTPGATFDAKSAQLKGQVFLQAFESLKGGGQITEAEGQKATDAMARLDKAQSSDDYAAALADLRSVVVAGQERARAKGRSPSQGQTPARPSRSAIQAEIERRRKAGLLK